MSILQILETIGGGGGLLIALMTLVQFSPVKINPWSSLAKVIKTALYADISERLNGIEKKLDAHVTTDDKRTAEAHRARILHFNNELLRDIGHTREEFFEVLTEIDAYEDYCRDHPEYPNNRAVLAIENIQEVYKERQKKHDFLQESHVKSDPEDYSEQGA